MATMTRSVPSGTDPAAGVADVFVIFGITGDLAKVMTFNSLYRLEARGLLDCPIVGVAFDDWTMDQLRDRAKTSIETASGEKVDPAVFDRLVGRMSYVQGDFGDDATYERVGEAIKGAHTPVFYLEIPPFLFGRVIKGLSEAGLTKTGRVVVEKPFGHDRESARELADELHAVPAGVPDLPDRPLPREDGHRGDPLHPVREHDARADLEPEPRSVRRNHDGGGFRGRGPGTLLRPGGRAARRRRQPPDAGGRGHGDGAAVRCRPQHVEGLPARGLPCDRGRRSGALRPRTVRRLPSRSTASQRTRRRRPTPRCASTSTTGGGPASRSSSARASGCRSCRPRSGSCSRTHRGSRSAPARKNVPSRTSSW